LSLVMLHCHRWLRRAEKGYAGNLAEIHIAYLLNVILECHYEVCFFSRIDMKVNHLSHVD